MKYRVNWHLRRDGKTYDAGDTLSIPQKEAEASGLVGGVLTPVEDEPDEALDATDAAIELATEHGIDLAEVEGTGADGRILVGDVEALIEE